MASNYSVLALILRKNLLTYVLQHMATIIGIRFIKINNTDEPVVLPSGYKINNICPRIKVVNKVITEYNIAILLLFHILSPSITPSTNRAKLEPFDKTNAGSPHKYKLSAFQSATQTQSFPVVYSSDHRILYSLRAPH